MGRLDILSRQQRLNAGPPDPGGGRDVFPAGTRVVGEVMRRRGAACMKLCSSFGTGRRSLICDAP